MNGDGRADRVWLTPQRDGFLLHVRTASGTVTVAQRLRRSEDPRILALRRLGTRRGLEIEVLVDHGASNDFIVFYTLLEGRLIAMRGGPHDPADPPFVWDVGGFAMANTQADCLRRARVGVLSTWMHRGVWHYRATLYAVGATRFRKSSVFELASEHQVTKLPKDWPRLRRAEFESCR